MLRMNETTTAQQLHAQQNELDALEARENLEYTELAKAERLRDSVWSAQDSLGGIVYRIPEERVEALQKKIVAMQKRCAKLDIDPPTFADTGEREEVVEKNEQQTWAFVVVGGHPPVLAGWQFLATLQHEEAGTIIRRVPSVNSRNKEILSRQDLTAEYKNAKPVCDHCNKRRVRRDTYIVLHLEDGEVRQVGSTCLRDFLGGLSPEQAAKGFEYITKGFDVAAKFQGEGFSGLRAEPVYDTEEFMTHTALIVRRNGWVSKAKSQEWEKPSTAGLAQANLNNYLNREHDRAYPHEPLWENPTDEDKALAKAALESARNLPGDSDYEHNLKVALATDHIKVRSAGIVASAVGIYWLKNREKPEAKDQGLNEYFGQIKDRIEVKLTVEKVIEHYSYNPFNDSGVTYIHKMKDAEGRTFTWFGTYSLNENETYEGRWTVKSHNDYKRRKETVVNRPAKLEEV
jgi:hypothetical protein